MQFPAQKPGYAVASVFSTIAKAASRGMTDVK
jgi:hypothetical protein